MKLFKLNDNYKCEIAKDEVLLIPEFKALFELKYNKQKGDQQGRLRLRATAELTYIYFMHSYESELINYNQDERKVEALLAADLPENYIVSTELEIACKKFEQLQETRALKLLSSVYIAIDKMRTYFENIDYTKETNSGGLVNDPGRVAKTIEGLDKMLDSTEKLEKKVKSQLRGESKNRGDKEEGRIK